MNPLNDKLIKYFLTQMDNIITARHKTLEKNLIDEIKAAEERIRKEMATKDDLKHIEQKFDKNSLLQSQIDDLRQRVTKLELLFRPRN